MDATFRPVNRSEWVCAHGTGWREPLCTSSCRLLALARYGPRREATMAITKASFGDALRAWKRKYLAAARKDGFRCLLDRHGYDPETERSQGERLVERLSEVLAYALATRGLDQAPEEDAIRRFLDEQAYGTRPDVGFSILLGCPQEAELFVKDLVDIDLEDLFDGLEPMDITVTWLGEPLGAAEAAEMEQDVLADVGYGGDTFDAHWEREGAQLVVRRSGDEE